ncbi:hypothetical protein AWC38_SpisGene6273 [Stylophora pistillata]|uniref:Uncharacterized protein n=1 Tax=Stylophora pistillata TaxID=50429 RepID=A0A2B4SJE9_STYPI|nr:hypothetical protein AWC38_SpisGene6273 [Stylophora pistillata]
MEFSEHDGGIMDSGEHDDGNFEDVSTVAGDNVPSESLHAVNGARFLRFTRRSYVWNREYSGHKARQRPHPMLCCICKDGHLGANCDYSWVLPTVHGAPTDEFEIVNIEDEPQHSPSTDVNIEDDQQDSSSIDENLPLASVFPPPAQSAEQPIHPSPEQPVSDLTAQPLPEQSKEFNQPDPDPLSEQSAQPSKPSTSSSQSKQPV